MKLKPAVKIITWILMGIFIILLGFIGYQEIFNKTVYIDGFLAADTYVVSLYDEAKSEIKEEYRGMAIKVKEIKDDENYYEVKIEKEIYYLKKENFSKIETGIVKEEEIYLRTNTVLYQDSESYHIIAPLKKGEQLLVTGSVGLNEKGKVTHYKVGSGEKEGFVREKYTTFTKELADLNYDEENNYKTHDEEGRERSFSGGDPSKLDYYPEEKPKFENNVMPEIVYSWYLNTGVLKNVDLYIALAEGTKINAFVVDIKDNKAPGYKSKVFEEYAPTNYKWANNTVEEYQTAIAKLKDAGFYVIGRITTFKDEYYINDHPEYAALKTNTTEPYRHQNTYWPSPFIREVWEYNIALAKEAVTLMGFNEIQFDYVRFPDLTSTLEKNGLIDFQNKYDEEKAEAIQNFLLYARDELHEEEVYISADVFGESANTYVTAYGQYWPAISNVVDVISAMPYPDHFNEFEYGFKVPVWTIPYDLLTLWGGSVMKRQAETPSPAIVRTWIQGYNVTVRSNREAVTYNAAKMTEQIEGLFDAGLNGGYMVWEASSSRGKLENNITAYQKDYKEE